MDVVEIILLAVGTALVLVGYVYNKFGGSKKKVKIPDNYTEHIGICKKHIEKNGKFHEVFEIVHDDKTLKYIFPAQDSKDELRGIDSIEKFYINNDDPKDIKSSMDFIEKRVSINKKKQYTSYIMSGIGLVYITIVLIKLAFFDYK